MKVSLSGNSLLCADGEFRTVADIFRLKDLVGECPTIRTSDGSVKVSEISSPKIRECIMYQNKLGNTLYFRDRLLSLKFDNSFYPKGLKEVDNIGSLMGFLVMYEGTLLLDYHCINVTQGCCPTFGDMLDSLAIDYEFLYCESLHVGEFRFSTNGKLPNCENIFSQNENFRASFMSSVFVSKMYLGTRVLESDELNLFLQKVAATLSTPMKFQDGTFTFMDNDAPTASQSETILVQSVSVDKMYELTLDCEDAELWVDGYFVKLNNGGKE